ncbi:hypothetical protein QAD02_001850 [Eretmocerus hayati]|uniref:Uncharacterized protein n=1 Tax=Eretmocerus hayati TaxID=131215 RepID=A0ACC2NI38_9HYME|nr:hypothetical protein QAD02_001850 [Eretmocerus hayati]
MSENTLRVIDTSPTRQPRQTRTHSVGLPERASLFPDPLNPGGIFIPPALPRRHSATPADVKPPIPKRSKYERPIPVCNQTQQQQNLQSSSSTWSSSASLSLFQNANSGNENFERRPSAAEEAAAKDAIALDEASKNLGKQLQKISGSKGSSAGHHHHHHHLHQNNQGTGRASADPSEKLSSQNCTLRASRSLRRSERVRSSGQKQSRCDDYGEDDDYDDDEPRNSRYTEMQAAARRLESKLPELERRFQSGRQEQPAMEKLEKLPKATQTNLPPPLSAICCQGPASPKPVNSRQDSNVSSDSFSQTSSPSYTSKTMEAPLLPHKHANGKVPGRALAPEQENPPSSPITKSISTPAGLQTIVRFQNGSNMSLHHRIIRDLRRPSSHYVTRGRLRFRFAQVLANAVILMAIAGGLAAYFKKYPTTAIKVIRENKTGPTSIGVSNPLDAITIVESDNPAPGICLQVIISFCLNHKIPYNYTVFPNYMGNFGQRDAQHELEMYDAVIDVRCYELAALFLCSVFVPKCGPKGGQTVRPCRNLCFETKRRCGFFLDVFGLSLPEYLECDYFPESPDPDVCVGHQEVIDAERRAAVVVCPSGFRCDTKRCIPLDWRCDGHVDCQDHTDEIECGECKDDERTGLAAISSRGGGRNIYGIKSVLSHTSLHCGERRCMSASHVCDGVPNCPWAQDERNCLRLSERNGDVGKGRLEVYDARNGSFIPACVKHLTSATAKSICELLGYKSVDHSKIVRSKSNVTVDTPLLETPQSWRLTHRNQTNLLQQFKQCSNEEDYQAIDLVCSGYECGRRSEAQSNWKARKRIIGGVESAPGDWPFLAALLGGPEQVFYCAGVLIADQWVLTASHCVGNHSDVSGWTIQLGITRRHAHSYLGRKMKVKRVVPHPNYNFIIAHDNDVALFQLEHRVEFHEHLRPVCLPSANIELAPGTVCTVIGWGKKEDTETSEYEPAVNEVKVPVLAREICNSWLLNKDLNVTDGMICAGYPEGGKDACQGDSGGPLLCQSSRGKDRWFVGGIVSWGIKCAHPRLPGVYAYVPKYVPWILKIIDEFSEND